MNGNRHALQRAVFIASLLLATTVAHASSVQRSFTPRFSVTARGDLLIVGNTLMTCPDADAACPAARAGGAVNNNAFNMAWTNTDNVVAAPANSSTATLSIPGGSTVLFAGLYWGADTSAGAGGSGATPGRRNEVRFATPASGYVNTTASVLDASGTRYSGFADVTARVQAGGSGTYKVSGIQAGTGADRYAGWALVVVVGNPALSPRNMVVFDGYATINTSPPSSVTTTVSGFRTPPAGAVTTRIGAVAFEGDAGATGDSFQVNGQNVSNGLNPATNFFNSSITTLGTAITAKNPNYANQLGFDIDVASPTVPLGNNATSASLTFTTTNETYFPNVLTFTTDVFQPVVESNLIKSVVDVNGGSVAPGDILEYTLAYANTGNDGTLQTVVTDNIPANTTYVAGSLSIPTGANAGTKTDAATDDQANFIAAAPARVVFRIGTGATGLVGGTLAPGNSGTVRFRVQVNAAAAEGTSIPNTASVSYVEQSLGTTVTANSNTVTSTVSNRADLSLTKTDETASVTTNNTTTYTLVLTNNGPAAANNAVLRDPAATGLNCLAPAASGSATCEATGGALCPGGGLSGTVPVSSLQAAGGATITTFPAGGVIRIQVTCLVTATGQ
ncbi:MAG: hypothetical protein ACREO7_00105 [Pseudoxanthomonas sp.]